MLVSWLSGHYLEGFVLSLLKTGLPGGKALNKDCKRNLTGPIVLWIPTQLPRNALGTC